MTIFGKRRPSWTPSWIYQNARGWPKSIWRILKIDHSSYPKPSRKNLHWHFPVQLHGSRTKKESRKSTELKRWIVTVRNFHFATRIVCRADVSDDDFWRAAKTGDSRTRTGVTFGRQPTQVFGRPCRRTQRVIALRRNFWLKRLTKEGGEKEYREWYETRPPGWYYSLNWTLTVQTCCLEPVLKTRAQTPSTND